MTSRVRSRQEGGYIHTAHDLPSRVSRITASRPSIEDPSGTYGRRPMCELGDADSPFEEFEFAQGGAFAHLETMAQAARDSAQDVLTSAVVDDASRGHAQRLNQVADQCDALGVLISFLDLPPAADGV
jgi:hypothetical protein